MAPEQTRGDSPGAATDVFALAIIAWELFTGLPLFDGADIESILAAVRRADAPPLRPSSTPTCRCRCRDAVARALSPDPAGRGSAAELGAAFREAMRQVPGGAGARALSEWLERVYPPAPPRHDRAETDRTAVAVPAAHGTRPGSEEGTDTVLEPEGDGAGEAGAGEPVALLERRRAVGVAARLEGGEPETRRELCRILSALAYKRGAVLHSEEDDAVLALFGLEIAGEDDVAHAMAYALDALEAVREAGRGARPTRSEPKVRPEEIEGGTPADTSRPDRGHQRLDAHDVHDAGQIVGQHVQRHLGCNLRQRLYQEVRDAHAGQPGSW